MKFFFLASFWYLDGSMYIQQQQQQQQQQKQQRLPGLRACGLWLRRAVVVGEYG